MHSLKSLTIMILGLALLSACDDEPQTRAAGGWGGAAKVVTAQIELRPLVDEIEAHGDHLSTEGLLAGKRAGQGLSWVRSSLGGRFGREPTSPIWHCLAK